MVDSVAVNQAVVGRANALVEELALRGATMRESDKEALARLRDAYTTGDDEEKSLLAAKVDQLVEQLKAENARLASEKERVEGEKQRLYYDYKKLLRRGSSKSTRGSATSASQRSSTSARA